MQGDGENGGFAGNVFTVVVVGEFDFNVFAFAFFQAADAGFEFRQHLALAEYEGVVFGAAAFKGDAVDGAGKVDDDAVVVLRGALDAVVAGALFAQDVDGFVHFGIAHFGGGFFYFQRGEVADFDFGIDFVHAHGLEGIGVFLVFNRFDAGQGGHAQVFAFDGFFKGFAHGVVQYVVLDAGAVHGGDHFQRCFAGAEAVDAHAAGSLLQAAVGFGVYRFPCHGNGGFAFQRVHLFGCFAHGGLSQFSVRWFQKRASLAQ